MSRRAKYTPIDSSYLGFTFNTERKNVQVHKKIKNDVVHEQVHKKIKNDVVHDPIAICKNCQRKYYILPNSPLFDPHFDRSGTHDDDYELGWVSLNDGTIYLKTNTECPECSFSWLSLGWCMITDSIVEDDDTEINAIYKRIQKRELKKYDDQNEAGKKVQKFLKPVKN